MYVCAFYSIFTFLKLNLGDLLSTQGNSWRQCWILVISIIQFSSLHERTVSRPSNLAPCELASSSNPSALWKLFTTNQAINKINNVFKVTVEHSKIWTSK